jgi:hypothetical protein
LFGECIYLEKLNPWGFDLLLGIATSQPKDLPYHHVVDVFAVDVP